MLDEEGRKEEEQTRREKKQNMNFLFVSNWAMLCPSAETWTPTFRLMKRFLTSLMELEGQENSLSEGCSGLKLADTDMPLIPFF